MRHIKYPLEFDGRGRTAESGTDGHLRDMIEQVLFTSPGERVNRPDFGCGLLQMTFEPNSSELAETKQFMVQAALQQWLGDLIEVLNVRVDVLEATCKISVDYIIRRTQQPQQDQFSQ